MFVLSTEEHVIQYCYKPAAVTYRMNSSEIKQVNKKKADKRAKKDVKNHSCRD